MSCIPENGEKPAIWRMNEGQQGVYNNNKQVRKCMRARWNPNDTVQKLLKDSRLRHVSFSDKKARHTFPDRAQYATHSLKGTVSQRALHETQIRRRSVDCRTVTVEQ